MATKPPRNPYENVGPNTNASEITSIGHVRLLQNDSWYREQTKAAIEQIQAMGTNISIFSSAGMRYDTIGASTNAAQIKLMESLPLLRNDPWFFKLTTDAIKRTEGCRADIDYDGLAARLDEMKKYQLARLLRFFKSRPSATFQEIIDDCYGANDKEYAESTIRSYVSRLNDTLKADFMSPLEFETSRCAVIKRINPA